MPRLNLLLLFSALLSALTGVVSTARAPTAAHAAAAATAIRAAAVQAPREATERPADSGVDLRVVAVALVAPVVAAIAPLYASRRRE
ncbi:hypothetical protein [uncultured Sphingomonas sp.]|uniref:hypothetical protein n=1 Tax=uncultured Sphingomonas sp. TaxID=158754 RepID=UPI0035CB5229